MRFATNLDHKKFFHKNRYIEFTEILSANEAKALKENADRVLLKRLSCKEEQIAKKSTKDIFTQGRDFWREDPSYKKIALHQNLANIAASLVGAQTFRMGYDHYIRKGYDAITLSPTSLQNISSIQKIYGGMLIRISGTSESLTNETAFPIPKNPGDAIFFHPEYLLSWEALFQDLESSFYLIVYAHGEARYIPNEKDIQPNFLKKVGYMQGEFLRNDLNPLFPIKHV